MALRSGNHTTRIPLRVLKSQTRIIHHQPMVIHRLQFSRPRVLQTAPLTRLSGQRPQREKVHKKLTLPASNDKARGTETVQKKADKIRQYEPSGAKARSKARDEKYNRRRVWEDDQIFANETSPAPRTTLSLREKVLLE
ncbi:hypothetical protein SC171_21665 [Pantoea cypripedii]|uniref:hypothetical protein n=1 Tax=Pantoea cypripedii TaxID=55209 RepID=UPI002FCAD635